MAMKCLILVIPFIEYNINVNTESLSMVCCVSKLLLHIMYICVRGYCQYLCYLKINFNIISAVNFLWCSHFEDVYSCIVDVVLGMGI